MSLTPKHKRILSKAAFKYAAVSLEAAAETARKCAECPEDWNGTSVWGDKSPQKDRLMRDLREAQSYLDEAEAWLEGRVEDACYENTDTITEAQDAVEGRR